MEHALDLESENLELKKKLLTKIAFGGTPVIANTEEIELKCIQINENFRLHTDYFYNQSLKTINKSYRITKKIPKVTAKIHINNIYENKLSRFDQVKRIVDCLGFIPDDFHISIVGNYSYSDFSNEYYDNFLLKCNKSFGIKKIFIETFPDNEKALKKIIQSKKVFGSSYPENIFHISYIDKYFNSNPFFTYSILGNPNWRKKYFSKEQMDYINQIYITESKSMIDLNLEFFMKKINNNNLQYGVTNCKNINQYKNFFAKIDLIIEKSYFRNLSKSYNFPKPFISLSSYRIFKNYYDYKYIFWGIISLIKRIIGCNHIKWK